MGSHAHLYKLKAWRDPINGRRAVQLAYKPLCEMCADEGRTTVATIADHDPPHRGDVRIFLEGHLQSLCKRHHDSDKQIEETRGYKPGTGDDGWPLDDRHPIYSRDQT